MHHWVKYVVEVDVVGYFDHVNHDWLRKFLRHRVNDGGLLRLIDKWLKAGVMENGVVTTAEDGTPQGGPSFARVGDRICSRDSGKGISCSPIYATSVTNGHHNHHSGDGARSLCVVKRK